MGLSVWRETSKKLTVYRVCHTPIETLLDPWRERKCNNYAKLINNYAKSRCKNASLPPAPAIPAACDFAARQRCNTTRRSG